MKFCNNVPYCRSNFINNVWHSIGPFNLETCDLQYWNSLLLLFFHYIFSHGFSFFSPNFIIWILEFFALLLCLSHSPFFFFLLFAPFLGIFPQLYHLTLLLKSSISLIFHFQEAFSVLRIFSSPLSKFSHPWIIAVSSELLFCICFGLCPSCYSLPLRILYSLTLLKSGSLRS